MCVSIRGRGSHNITSYERRERTRKKVKVSKLQGDDWLMRQNANVKKMRYVLFGGWKITTNHAPPSHLFWHQFSEVAHK
jgi:hypothetical protein